MSENVLSLDYFDKAILFKSDKYNVLYRCNLATMQDYFIKSINKLSEGSKNLFPGEHDKSETETVVLKEALSFAKDCMIYYKRKKIMEIPLEMVHVIPEGLDIKVNPVFRGIVIERSGNELLDALVATRRISEFMFFKTIKNGEDRKFFLYETGSIYREAVADFLSRKFYEERIVGKGLLKNTTIFEGCFDPKKEALLNSIVEDTFKRGEGLFSKEEVLQDVINNIINGTISPFISLESREITIEEF